MDTEIETNSSDRYLLCTYSITGQVIDSVKNDIKAFMAAREGDDKNFEFINWQKGKNEIAVLTMYAYDDIVLPKKFDTVFQIDKPNNFVHTECTITQAVLNGQTCVNRISRGHKHICVIQFIETVDDIFNLLTPFDPRQPANNNVDLGICAENDFVAIKRILEQKSR